MSKKRASLPPFPFSLNTKRAPDEPYEIYKARLKILKKMLKLRSRGIIIANQSDIDKQ